MGKPWYVYFLTDKSNCIMYVGATDDLKRRTAEHKAYVSDGCRARYGAMKLVYFEECASSRDALKREWDLKKQSRAHKDALVKLLNPAWQDLSRDIGLSSDYVLAVHEDTARGRDVL